MLLAIDPGTTESAYCLMDGYKPVQFGKLPNLEMLSFIYQLDNEPEVVIEKVASYGMPVGEEVFETCVWTGRFIEAIFYSEDVARITRHEIKQAICHSVKANDATIKQALVDRFAYNVPNHGKGSKKEKGWFYGFKADIWSSYAIAVVHLDRKRGHNV